jgi:hypothetical protein
LDERQKEDLFLYVRRQIEQLHDLRYAGSGHPTEARQFRIILNRRVSWSNPKVFVLQWSSRRIARATSRTIRGSGQPLRDRASVDQMTSSGFPAYCGRVDLVPQTRNQGAL